MATIAQRAPVRHTAAPLPFYSCDAAGTPLLSVNENISFDALLENAGCFMISVEKCMLSAAEEVDHPAAWGAYYMLQTAHALIDAMSIALHKADSTEAQTNQDMGDEA